jgi:hypothetical protein
MSSTLTIAGLVSIGLALAVSGVLSSGDRMRANYHDEEKEDRAGRLKTSGILLLLGIILLVTGYLFS